MSLILLLVSCIGLTFGPVEPMAYGLYNVFSVLGTNPSFSPITVDMSMMTSIDGENNFVSPLHLEAVSENSESLVLRPSDLNLYRLKIPIILLLEQAVDQVDLTEARYAICHQLQNLLGKKLLSFSVKKRSDAIGESLFQKEFLCDFATL